MKRTSTLLFIIAGLILLPPSPVSAGELLAQLPTRTLSGKPFVLPAELANNTQLLIVGFSRASRQQVDKWFQNIQRHDDNTPTDVSIYKVEVLDVPEFLQGFIIGKIRDSVPEKQRRYYLLAVQNIDTWKKLSHFKYPDRAYLILLDAGHHIIWQCGSMFSPERFNELLKQFKYSRQSVHTNSDSRTVSRMRPAKARRG